MPFFFIHRPVFAWVVALFIILLGLIAPEAKGFVAYGRDGTPAAAALAVVSGGIGVYLNVVTDRARRRQSHGEAVMQARHAALQVVADNDAAGAHYAKLGFTERYRYHYRRPA